MPDFIKGFRNIKKNSPRVIRLVAVKTLIDFMCNWQQLCTPWVTRYDTGLTLCKKFVMYKLIVQRIEYKPFRGFTKDRNKTNWTIIFYQIVLTFLWTGTVLLFFQSSGKMPTSNIVLKSNWSGKNISFPHNWIILIDMLSHPWALSALRIFIITKMSF